MYPCPPSSVLSPLESAKITIVSNFESTFNFMQGKLKYDEGRGSMQPLSTPPALYRRTQKINHLIAFQNLEFGLWGGGGMMIIKCCYFTLDLFSIITFLRLEVYLLESLVIYLSNRNYRYGWVDSRLASFRSHKIHRDLPNYGQMKRSKFDKIPSFSDWCQVHKYCQSICIIWNVN